MSRYVLRRQPGSLRVEAIDWFDARLVEFDFRLIRHHQFFNIR